MLLAQTAGGLPLTDPAFLMWTAIVLICIVPSLGWCWAHVKKAELDAGLKQSMIDRGMSADEIDRVLRAKSGDTA